MLHSPLYNYTFDPGVHPAMTWNVKDPKQQSTRRTIHGLDPSTECPHPSTAAGDISTVVGRKSMSKDMSQLGDLTAYQ